MFGDILPFLYFCSELEATTEEYRLLEQMNKLTLTKYSDMSQITEKLLEPLIPNYTVQSVTPNTNTNIF